MPAISDDPTTLEVMWSELREKLRHVFVPRESFGMSKAEYMNIHTLVYNYCTSVSVQNNAVGGLLRGALLHRFVNFSILFALLQHRHALARETHPASGSIMAPSSSVMNSTAKWTHSSPSKSKRSCRCVLDSHLDLLLPFRYEAD